MALVIADRVRETSATTGTGTFTLAGAVTGFQSFSTAIGNANTCYYAIVNVNEYEVGLGTVGAGTIARTTVLMSSNANALVNFSAGTKDVFVTYPAGKAVYKDSAGDVVGLKIGTDIQAYDADLGALAALATAGVIARTGAGTVAARTLTAGTNISITNGDGVAGDPTINAVNVALLAANTFTAAQEWATGTAVASAATINLNTATGNRVHITGATTITAVTLTRGPRTVIFDGILTLTHHATNNNLPGAANITTAAGDRAIYESDGTTVYCVSYIKVSGTAVVAASSGGITTIASGAFPAAAVLDITNIPATYAYLVLQVTGVSSDTAANFLLTQVSVDNGSSFDTTANKYLGFTMTISGNANTTLATLGTYSSQAGVAELGYSTVVLSGYQGGCNLTYVGRTTHGLTDRERGIGTYVGSTSAINALRFLWSAGGNFDAGTYALYGVS